MVLSTRVFKLLLYYRSVFICIYGVKYTRLQIVSILSFCFYMFLYVYMGLSTRVFKLFLYYRSDDYIYYMVC